MRKTRIVATLGPASSSPEMIRKLAEAGANAFRLNCSHLSSRDLEDMIDVIRGTSSRSAILVDIQGPKMRYSGEELTIEPGATTEFPYEILGLAHVAREGGLDGLRAGHRLLLDDGRIEGTVVEAGSASVRARFERGGTLRRNKGVNLPDTSISGGVLSDKDRKDIDVARDRAVEFVAVSFVQEPADVVSVKRLLDDHTSVIAKIERPQALDRLDEICRACDGVMAARGDLGVELPYESIPAAQRRIGNSALRSGRIAICATEMLESMITSSRPTRAEVADVSAAVHDGFDAVMLSGETAVGRDPVGTVAAMARICEAAEHDVTMPNVFADANPQLAAVTAATSALAKRVGADSIISLTYTGYSARLLAACRPSNPIIAVTPSERVARGLNLCRGVNSVVAPRPAAVGEAIVASLEECRSMNLLTAGDIVVICASRVSPRSDADTILLHVEPDE